MSATTKKKPRLSFRYGIRVMLAAVTLFAIFLGGWTARDTGLGGWFRPYTLKRQFTVSAKNNQADPLPTGIRLKRGDVITFQANKTDRWSAHGTKGPLADYSGSPGYPARLRLHYQIGNQTGFVANGTRLQVLSNGPLELFCRDDDVGNNHGTIRVAVKLSSSTKPDALPPSKVISSPNSTRFKPAEWVVD